MAAKHVVKGKAPPQRTGVAGVKLGGTIKINLTVRHPSNKLQAEKKQLVEEIKRLDADAAHDGLQIRARSGITMRLKDAAY